MRLNARDIAAPLPARAPEGATTVAQGTITAFAPESHAMRTIEREGEPWFVLADVCRVLEIGAPSHAARRLDEHERDTLDNIDGIASSGTAIVSASGLHRLVRASRRKWAVWGTWDEELSAYRHYLMPALPLSALPCATVRYAAASPAPVVS